MRARTTSFKAARASVSAFSTISRQRRIWSYGSGGGSASPGMIGAVPATWTRSATTTARLYPQRSSRDEPDEMTLRSTDLVSPAVDALRIIDEWGARTATAGVTRGTGEIGAHG